MTTWNFLTFIFVLRFVPNWFKSSKTVLNYIKHFKTFISFIVAQRYEKVFKKFAIHTEEIWSIFSFATKPPSAKFDSAVMTLARHVVQDPYVFFIQEQEFLLFTSDFEHSLYNILKISSSKWDEDIYSPLMFLEVLTLRYCS